MGDLQRCAAVALTAVALLAGCAAEPDGVEDFCRTDYSDAACRCFDGMLSVQLSAQGYLGYAEALKTRRSELRFDGGVAQSRLTGRDKRVCIDASDICGVPACEPDPAPSGTCLFPDGRCDIGTGDLS